MDAKYLEEIKERYEKTTRGDWEASRDGSVGGKTHVCHCSNNADADFIAHSRIDIPALLAEVERLTEECSTLKVISEIHRQNLVILANRVNVWDKALEMMYLDNKDYNPYGMKNPTYYIQQAQKQERKK